MMKKNIETTNEHEIEKINKELNSWPKYGFRKGVQDVFVTNDEDFVTVLTSLYNQPVLRCEWLDSYKQKDMACVFEDNTTVRTCAALWQLLQQHTQKNLLAYFLHTLTSEEISFSITDAEAELVSEGDV